MMEKKPTPLSEMAPAPETPPEPTTDEDLRAEVEALVAGGAARMDAIKQIASRHGLGKREVYRVMESEDHAG